MGSIGGENRAKPPSREQTRRRKSYKGHRKNYLGMQKFLHAKVVMALFDPYYTGFLGRVLFCSAKLVKFARPTKTKTGGWLLEAMSDFFVLYPKKPALCLQNYLANLNERVPVWSRATRM